MIITVAVLNGVKSNFVAGNSACHNFELGNGVQPPGIWIEGRFFKLKITL